jgi:hypothetical protein
MSLFRLFVSAVMLNFATTCTAAEPLSPQVAIVTMLYHDFAFEAVLENSVAEGFIDQPKKVLIRYLTPQLAELLLRDRRCATTTHEICRLDFVPLWGNQDPSGSTVQVQPGASPDTVVVRLRYSSSTTQLTYHLTQSSSGWKIRDISYGQGQATLAEILESKL